MVDYSKIFHKYGREWDPSFKADESNQNCPYKFAVNVRNRIEQILHDKKLLELCPNLKLTITYIENNTVNAVACKGSQIEEDYLIAVFAGAYFRLFDIFTSEDFISNLRPNLKIFEKLSNDNLALNCLSYAISYLFFHEVGHVYRGHLKYFPKRNSSLTSSVIWDEQHEICTDDEKNGGEATNKRHLSECDADAFSGMMVGAQIYTGSQSIYRNNIFNNAPLINILNDSIFLASMSIHTVFCIFNEHHDPLNHDYPHPIIRSGNLHGHIAQKLISLDSSLDASSLALLLTRSTVSINAIAAKLGIDIGYDDISEEFINWKNKYWDSLHSLGAILQTYSPCKSK